MTPSLIPIKGNITELQVDAIVNAANSTLLGGGRVDGAIHRAAGPKLLEACKKLQGCPTGEAKLTDGFRLPAKFVIHTVGPVWHGGTSGEAKLLAACYRNSLTLAAKHSIKTIAFPCISCGVYRFPLSEAVDIAINETKKFLKEHPDIDSIYFVCFDDQTFNLYKEKL